MRAWYENLSERDRRFVIIGAPSCWCSYCLAIILPLNTQISLARKRITTKQGDLAFIQSVAPQVAAAGPARPGPPMPNHWSC